tara:strand:+ start:2769 stop:3353 length:585 start_codon:yes stop_codon:yes gene_type:complete
MVKQKNINNSIGIFDNYIDLAVCDELIKLFELNVKKNLVVNRQVADGITKNKKDDTALFCFRGNTWDDANEEVIARVNDCLQDYEDETSFNRFCEINELNHANQKIQKTLPGQGYHVWHVERMYAAPLCKRALVYTLYLNDEFEAGETEFLKQEIRVKPKKGRIVIWPASYPFIHRGNPPLKGHKFILTSWLLS